MFTYNSNDGVFYIPCLWYMADVDPEKCSGSTEKRDVGTEKSPGRAEKWNVGTEKCSGCTEKWDVDTEKREGSTPEWEESRIPCILQKHLFKNQIQQINRNNNRMVVMDP